MTSAQAGPKGGRYADRAARSEDLLQRVIDGDREAFSLLYDEVAPIVYGTAHRVLRDPDHAAEVTQEVMVEIWRKAPRFVATHGTVPAWATTIARRRAVDRVRSVQSDRDRDDRAVHADFDRPHDEVAEEVERRSDQRAVVKCLETLTPTQRTAVISTYYDGYTYREAAERSQTALPTMKSRIRDGLARLRQCLEGRA